MKVLIYATGFAGGHLHKRVRLLQCYEHPDSGFFPSCRPQTQLAARYVSTDLLVPVLFPTDLQPRTS